MCAWLVNVVVTALIHVCWFCSLCRSQWGFLSFSFFCLHLFFSSLIPGCPSCVCLSPRSRLSLSLCWLAWLCCLCSCVAALTQHSESVRSWPAPPLCSPRLLLCVSTVSLSIPPAHTHTQVCDRACVYLCESRALTCECFVFFTQSTLNQNWPCLQAWYTFLVHKSVQ